MEDANEVYNGNRDPKGKVARGEKRGAGERARRQTASEQDFLLHQGVLKGSSGAREEIASIHWRNLQKIFQARYRHCDPAIVGGGGYRRPNGVP